MARKDKLEVVLAVRKIEEEVSKARLAESLKRLDESRRSVEGARLEVEDFRLEWRRAAGSAGSAGELRLYPANLNRLKRRLLDETRLMEKKSVEVDGHRQDYAVCHRARRLLEGVVARRVRRAKLIQEVREQNERDEQVLMDYRSS